MLDMKQGNSNRKNGTLLKQKLWKTNDAEDMKKGDAMKVTEVVASRNIPDPMSFQGEAANDVALLW